MAPQSVSSDGDRETFFGRMRPDSSRPDLHLNLLDSGHWNACLPVYNGLANCRLSATCAAFRFSSRLAAYIAVEPGRIRELTASGGTRPLPGTGPNKIAALKRPFQGCGKLALL